MLGGTVYVRGEMLVALCKAWSLFPAYPLSPRALSQKWQVLCWAISTKGEAVQGRFSVPSVFGTLMKNDKWVVRPFEKETVQSPQNYISTSWETIYPGKEEIFYK